MSDDPRPNSPEDVGFIKRPARAESTAAGSAPSPAAPRHEPKACKSCGAPIFWAESDRTGVSMPVDAEPSGAGNIQLVDRRGKIVAQMLGGSAKNIRDAAWALTGKHTLRTSHFATCPNAAAHRRRGRG